MEQLPQPVIRASVSGTGDSQPSDHRMPAAERALWVRWRESQDVSAHQELATMYAEFARVVAASYYARRFDNEIEYAEYAQLAHLGMLEAIQRFDPSFGVQFKTFASRRMHGAILDGIERLTEKQQQIAAVRRLRAQRTQSLLAPDGDERPNGPVSRTPEQVLRFVSEIGLGMAVAWLLEGTGMVDSGDSSATFPFYQSVELRQLRERLLELVKALPSQQSKVVSAHYLQEMPFEEIARSQGLSKGRISQLHKQALIALRAGMQPLRR